MITTIKKILKNKKKNFRHRAFYLFYYKNVSYCANVIVQNKKKVFKN